MKKPSTIAALRRDGRQSAALVIVLIFISLAMGLTILFLSKATTGGIVSGNSANGTKAALFAQGALNTILGDLGSEIAAGTVTNGGVYTPATNFDMVPYPTGGNASSLPANVVKYSASGAPFFKSDGIRSYNAVGPSRAAALSSTNAKASLNGRSVTLAEWNHPLLLPRAKAGFDPTDPTPVTAGASPFVPPDWILVARDGSNPTAFSEELRSNPSDLAALTAVVGRFAYVIYDEGGTLDVNVAGSPSVLTNALQAPFRNGLAFADLTQVGLTAAQADQLIAWRNLGSLSNSISGSLPSFSFDAGATNYFGTVYGATNGFLGVQRGGSVSGDHLFTSRQQLIQFLLKGVARGNSASISKLEDALPSLGTFTRDLNQPSLVRRTSGVPTIQGAAAAGGNDAFGKDASINPSFLSLKVTSRFTRNDGTTAQVGEPLVKTRFALNRLAWLTYQGPSAIRNLSGPANGSNAPDADIWALENLYGFSQAYLQKGTGGASGNIHKYFGLLWTAGPPGYWSYDPGLLNAQGNICTLAEVLAQKREANFIELLKASILAGSVAKSFPGEVGDPNGIYTGIDSSIMQIAANIVAQSTCDGYPPRIDLTAGGTTRSFYGVKNLPFVYRVRNAYLTTGLPQTSTDPNMTAATLAVGGIASNPKYGAGIPVSPNPFGTQANDLHSEITAIQEVEVWNPHAWDPKDTSSKGYGMGNPRPTSFQLALSYPATTMTTWYPNPYTGNTFALRVSRTGLTNSFTATNAMMTFSVPTGQPDLFREPTLLITPNVPSGSALAGVTNASVAAYGMPTAYGGVYPAGFTATTALSNPASNAFVGPVFTKMPFVFFYRTSPGNVTPVSGNVWVVGQPAIAADPASSKLINYNLACQDPSGNWISYDRKAGQTVPDFTRGLADLPQGAPGAANSTPADFDWTMNGGANNAAVRKGSASYQDQMIPFMNAGSVFDPRTGRFGFQYNLGSKSLCGNYMDVSSSPRIGEFNTGSLRWGSPAQNVTETERPDFHGGYGLNALTAVIVNPATNTAVNFPPVNSKGWFWGGTNLSHGIFAANQKNLNADAFPYHGSVNSYPTTWSTAQYFADPDGVIRRGMAGHAVTNSTIGQPLATAVAYPNNYSSTTPATLLATTNGTPIANTAMSSMNNAFSGGAVANGVSGSIYSRPVILNRPFRSVAELSYTFSDTPWRNLDLSSPESGCTALLDVFCVQEAPPQGIVAGKINLNTRNTTAITALLNGAYQNTLTNNAPTYAYLSPGVASAAAALLVKRTTGTATGLGPLQNVAELVGKQVPATLTPTLTSPADGASTNNFAGYSSDLDYLFQGGQTDAYFNGVARFRETPIRALASAGTTRVWNLMIDVVAQVGRYPATAKALGDFYVEGQQRFWLHVAIDRLTGRVLDSALEPVSE